MEPPQRAEESFPHPQALPTPVSCSLPFLLRLHSLHFSHIGVPCFSHPPLPRPRPTRISSYCPCRTLLGCWNASPRFARGSLPLSTSLSAQPTLPSAPSCYLFCFHYKAYQYLLRRHMGLFSDMSILSPSLRLSNGSFQWSETLSCNPQT